MYRTSPLQWEMARTPKTNKAQTSTTEVQLELIFLLLLLQPSVKLRKTQIPTWRMRIQGCHHNGSIPLQPYWAWPYQGPWYSPQAMGTLPRSTQHLGPTLLGPRRTQSHSWPNRYTLFMTMDKVYTLGPTKSNKYVGS